MMKIEIYETKEETAEAAARKASEVLNAAVKQNGRANFIAATGASQFDFLEALTSDKSIDWGKTTIFHLDEYVGISEQHPASFRRYLKERLIDKVHPENVYLIEGNAKDPQAEANRMCEIILKHEISVSFVGVGENGHLAFNDPPADFETERAFLIVNLDKDCRRQQVNEGWFSNIDEVPTQAITISIKQIMKSKTIIAVVPGVRKAKAVRNCFGNEDISPMYPASILKKHPNAFIYLDKASAALLGK